MGQTEAHYTSIGRCWMSSWLAYFQ